MYSIPKVFKPCIFTLSFYCLIACVKYKFNCEKFIDITKTCLKFGILAFHLAFIHIEDN